ncbi:hypothetical protein D3C81_1962140 [compost metagenome]
MEPLNDLLPISIQLEALNTSEVIHLVLNTLTRMGNDRTDPKIGHVQQPSVEQRKHCVTLEVVERTGQVKPTVIFSDRIVHNPGLFSDTFRTTIDVDADVRW